MVKLKSNLRPPEVHRDDVSGVARAVRDTQSIFYFIKVRFDCTRLAARSAQRE